MRFSIAAPCAVVVLSLAYAPVVVLSLAYAGGKSWGLWPWPVATYETRPSDESPITAGAMVTASFAFSGAATNLEAMVSMATLMHERGLDQVKMKYEGIILRKNATALYFETWYRHNRAPDSSKRRKLGRKYGRAFVHGDLGLVFQTIPKNGCSVWRAFNIAISGRDPKAFEVHALGASGIPLMSSFVRRGTQSKLDNDASLLKVITVRNPITRTLSAYLSKKGLNMEPFWHRNFPEFVQAIKHQGLSSANEHFRPQIEFAAGAHFDVVAKFEDQSEWAPSLLEYLGDKINEKKEMIKNITNPSARASIAKVLVPRAAIVHRYKNDYYRMLNHYDMETFEAVEKLFAEDIAAFGYSGEVAGMKLVLAMAKSYGLK